MILYVNACVRADSRTKRLADYLLGKLRGPVTELEPAEISLPKVDEDFLRTRDRLLQEGNISHPMFGLARQFSEADEIVIAAPFWDLSFPAALKQYLEQINVVGITFRYTEEGVPVGMCRAKRLFYVTTVGGLYYPEADGCGYVRDLARSVYGIGGTVLIHADGLDIVGSDVERILRDCEAEIDRLFPEAPPSGS
jgi:FMN-dependent NADH-azoreductase